MEIKTYRASSIQEAIALVRQELGPDAAILHTRRPPRGILGLLGKRQLEVTASNELAIPSRFEHSPARPIPQPADAADYRAEYRAALARYDGSINELE